MPALFFFRFWTIASVFIVVCAASRAAFVMVLSTPMFFPPVHLLRVRVIVFQFFGLDVFQAEQWPCVILLFCGPWKQTGCLWS